MQTGGRIVWGESEEDFDWEKTTALPQNLKAKFGSEPFYLDLSWAKSPEAHLSLRHSDFRKAVLKLAARLYGRDAAELDSVEVREHRKNIRTAWAAGIALLVLTVAALVAAYSFVVQRNLAVAQRNLAVSRELAASALALLDADPELGLFLSTEAAGRAHTPEAEEALRQSLTRAPMRVMRGQNGTNISVKYSPDGRAVLVTTGRKTAQVWEAVSGRLLFELSGHEDGVNDAAFSSDGRPIVTGSDDNSARAWDAASGRTLFEMHGPKEEDGGDSAMRSAAFSPDGRSIVTASRDDSARVYDCELCGAYEEMLDMARSRLTRQLTPEERLKYLH